MTTKDAPPPHFSDLAGVQYSPVPAWNQPQPQTPNMILASLGGIVTPEENGDVVQRLEGYIPPTNRNGSSAVDDQLIARDKAARLQMKDTEPELGPFPRVVDPRDNDNAPDEWSDNQVASSKNK